ncbi:hemerythrin domain-containing protein [Sulfurivermis fontis]|jgi:hemerythrin-like domain-containing protein|uniref:hemerythrin domain-containing protein n=1 Tax=Sulfurivermis fontis TaxID=1972068 RepID=UPI000FD8DDAC|nr:hemerythrin domain-containing protein [Sulfurivermis fontis]
MTTITAYMENDHRRCDELFAAAERLVAAGEWSAAAESYGKFHQAIEHHFSMEEDELFPAFEAATGSTLGPTQVMRMEHGQMRSLFQRMDKALTAKDMEEYLGASDTLLILMQQHNMKEEQMLYPMSERALNGGDAVLQRMQSMGG